MADDSDDDVRIEHPNRKKAASKDTRLIVVVLLLASAALLAIITWGGWDTLEGAKPLQIAYIVTYLDRPNRRKASSKATKAIVCLLLVASAVIMIVISIGGWDTLEGAKPLQIAYIVLYLVMAFLVMRWNRGVLPLAAALAIVLLIFAAVSGPAWFDRDKAGLTDPTLDEDILGLLSLILVPVQILLIAFAMRGFQQSWNVEVERSTDERHSGDPAPAPA